MANQSLSGLLKTSSSLNFWLILSRIVRFFLSMVVQGFEHLHLLAIMLRDGFRGKLGWFNPDRKFLEVVEEKILLIERFLLKKKSLGEEYVEQLQEVYIQFMLLWEDSHHECKRERGERTCQEFEITPREAALGLVECLDVAVKKKGGRKREACETLRKVSNLLSHEVAQF